MDANLANESKSVKFVITRMPIRIAILARIIKQESRGNARIVTTHAGLVLEKACMTVFLVQKDIQENMASAFQMENSHPRD